MIESLNLRHFQSHKSSYLIFHPGVNAIIGTSNSGKSAIIRGLLWAWSNRPSGVDFVSHWNRDKNGNPQEPTSVTVALSSMSISRVRSKSFNGYEINTPGADDHGAPDHTLEAIGTDQPEEIALAFNFTEVNIQRQMDAPFLLSDNAADVARFLNSIIRLDLIDRVLSAAEGKRRKVKAAIEETQDQIKSLTTQVDSLAWIAQAESILNKAANVQARFIDKQVQRESLVKLCDAYRQWTLEVNTLQIRVDAGAQVAVVETLQVKLEFRRIARDRLAHSIQEYSKAQVALKATQPIIKAASLVEDLEKLRQAQAAKQTTRRGLAASIQSYIDDRALLKQSWLSKAFKLMEEAEGVRSYLETNREYAAQLSNLIDEYKEDQTIITMATATISSLIAEMPDTCPTCGAVYNKAKETPHAHS